MQNKQTRKCDPCLGGKKRIETDSQCSRCWIQHTEASKQLIQIGLKELKETMFKELKENMMIMTRENFSKMIEIFFLMGILELKCTTEMKISLMELNSSFEMAEVNLKIDQQKSSNSKKKSKKFEEK